MFEESLKVIKRLLLYFPEVEMKLIIFQEKVVSKK